MKKLLIASLAFLMAASAFAQLPVKFAASQDLSYDDNIYLTENGKSDSLISSTKVGANYKTKIPDSGLVLTAQGMVGYNAYTRDGGNNNFWQTLADVNIKNNMFTLGNTFLYTADPANNEITARAKRINNMAYFSAKSSTDKMFGLGLTVNDVFDRYMAAEWSYLNRNRINAGVQAYYNMSPKTSFFAEYVYSDIAYQTNTLNNSKGNSFALGVDGALFTKVTGTAKITYDTRNYSNNIDLPGFSVPSNNNELLGYLLNVEWTPTSTNTVGVTGKRSMEETIYFTNRFFADTQLMVYGSQKVYDRFTCSLSLAYNNMSYKYEDNNGIKRNDNLYTVRPAVDYQFMDWLSAGVWYQMRMRNSNTSGNDYDNNKVGAYVKGAF